MYLWQKEIVILPHQIEGRDGNLLGKEVFDAAVELLAQRQPTQEVVKGKTLGIAQKELHRVSVAALRDDCFGNKPLQQPVGNDVFRAVGHAQQDARLPRKFRHGTGQNHRLDPRGVQIGDDAHDDAAERQAHVMRLVDAEMIDHLHHLLGGGFEVELLVEDLQDRGLAMSDQIDEQQVEVAREIAHLTIPHLTAATCAVQHHHPRHIGLLLESLVMQHNRA